MTQQNFYTLLGIETTATETEIKKAYRAMALRYHPDSAQDGGSEYLFQLIAEAYSVLSDPTKRADYDQRHGLDEEREEKLKEYRKNQAYARKKRQEAGEKVDSSDPNRMWDAHTQGGGAFAGPSGVRFRSEQAAPSFHSSGPSIFESLREGLSSFFNSSPKPKKEKKKKSKDRPRGKTFDEKIRGERVYHFIIDALESLRGTNRELAIQRSWGVKKVAVTIPPGITSGTILRVSVPTPNGPVETVKVKVQILPHELVERNGLDITVKIPITIGEAIQGTELEIPTLNGSTKVKVPPAAKKSKRLRLKGMGVQNGEDTGDLYLRTYIVPPDQISSVVEEAVKAIDSHYLSDIRANVPKKLR